MGPPRAVRRRRVKDLMQLLTGVQDERGGAGASPDCPADAKSGATSVHDLENPECSWTGVLPPPPGGPFSGDLARPSFPILRASRLTGIKCFPAREHLAGPAMAVRHTEGYAYRGHLRRARFGFGSGLVAKRKLNGVLLAQPRYCRSQCCKALLEIISQIGSRGRFQREFQLLYNGFERQHISGILPLYLPPCYEVGAIEPDVCACIFSGKGPYPQYAVLGFFQVLGIHVLPAGIGKAEASLHQTFRGPGAALMPVAPAA